MRALITVLILLIIPLAAADLNPRIEVGGEQLQYIQPGAEITATLFFTPSPQTVIAEISSENFPDGAVRVDARPCEECSRQIRFYADQQVTFTFEENLQDGTVLPPQDFQVTYQVDGQAPTISNVQIGECESGCSYSGSSREFRFEVSDQPAGITQEQISVNINGIPATVGNEIVCEGAIDKIVCEGSFEGTGQKVIDVVAQDFAGNRAEVTRTIEYDGDAPRILDGPNLIGVGSSLAGGQPVNIEVYIFEQEAATIKIESAAGNGDGTCVLDERASERHEDANRRCDLTFVPENTRQTVTGTITITDRAGNEATRDITLDVYEGNTDVEPDFWEGSGSPRLTLDARTMTVHEKFYPLTLELSGPSQADIVYIDVKQCSWGDVPAANFDIGEVVTPRNNGPNRATTIPLTIPRLGNRAEDPSNELFRTDIVCDLEIFTRIGATVYATPEAEQVNFTPRVSTALLAPVDQIEREQEAIAERIAKRQQSLQKLYVLSDSLQRLCAIPPALQGSGSIIMGAAGPIAILPDPLNSPARGLENAGQSLRDAGGAANGMSAQLCSMVRCNQIDETPLGGFYSRLPGTGTDSNFGRWASAIGGAENPQALINPYKSEILAYGTMCLPAIVYHRQVAANAECQYQSCVQNARFTGDTPEDCKAQKDYLDCRLRVGNLVNAVPYVNIYEGALNNLQQAFSNPIGLIGLAGSWGCSGFPLNPLKSLPAERVAEQALPLQIRIPCKIVIFGDEMDAYLTAAEQAQQGFSAITQTQGSLGDMCAEAQAQFENVVEPNNPFEQGVNCGYGYCTIVRNGRVIVATENAVGVVQDTNNQQVAGLNDLDSIRERALFGGTIQSCGTQGSGCSDADRAFGEETFESYRNFIHEDVQLGTLGPQILEAANGVADRVSEAQNAYKQEQKEWGDTVAGIKGRAMDTPGLQPYNQFIDNFLSSCNPECDWEAFEEQSSQYLVGTIGSDFTNNEEVRQILEAAHSELLASRDASEDAEAARQAANEEIRRLVAQERQNALRAEYTTASGRVRRHLDSMRAFARFGNFMAGFGVDTQADWHDKYFKDPIGEVVQFTSVEEQLISNACDVRHENSEYAGIATGSVSGGTAARIAGTRARNDGEYQYLIELYLKVPVPVDETARITFEGGGRDVVDEQFDLRSPHSRIFGENPIVFTSQRSYQKVCIEFDRALEEYFEITIGADPEDRKLCATIRGAS